MRSRERGRVEGEDRDADSAAKISSESAGRLAVEQEIGGGDQRERDADAGGKAGLAVREAVHAWRSLMEWPGPCRPGRGGKCMMAALQCGLAGSASHQQSWRMLVGMKGRRMGAGRGAFMRPLSRAVGETVCPDQGEFREFRAGTVQGRGP